MTITGIAVCIICLVLLGCGETESTMQAETVETAVTSAETAATDIRTIDHALGTVEIPAEPQRVALIHEWSSDLLAVGVTPVATAVGPNAPESELEALGDAMDVGSVAEPDLEVVVASEPDLIIGVSPLHDEAYPQLSAIAPTVLLGPESGLGWRERFEQIAALVNQADAAAQRLAEFDEVAAAAAEELAAAVGDETVMMLRVLPQEFRIYGPNQFSGGEVLHGDLGLAFPEVEGLDDDASALAVALEVLPQIDPDHIFLLDQTDDAGFMSTSLWQDLDAVMAGQVYPIEAYPWVQGRDISGYPVLIEETVAALIGSEP